MSVPPLKLGSSSTKRGGEGVTPIPTSAAKAKPSSVGVYLVSPPPRVAPTVHTVDAPTASVIVAPTVHTVDVPIAPVITAPTVHTVDVPVSSAVLQTQLELDSAKAEVETMRTALSQATAHAASEKLLFQSREQELMTAVEQANMGTKRAMRNYCSRVGNKNS